MLLAEFRDYMQKGYYFENIKTYTDQDYVFIDDIGSEKTSEFVIEFLYILINKRYENMKRTVFATNLSINDFQERYGDRIMSRIAEMCILVEITGGDKRLN
jgi:DNA replication protein DnaC